MRNLLFVNAIFISFYSSAALAHGELEHQSKLDGFGGHVDINFIGSSNYDADDTAEEFNELQTHSHADIYYNFNEDTSLSSSIELEAEHEHSHGGGYTDDKFFQHHSLKIKEIYLNHKINNSLNVYAGKISPAFAFDPEEYTIVWAQEPSEDYAIEEKLGIGFGYDITEKQSVNISTFFADTTFMSDSLFYNPEHNNDEDDAGAGNTEALNNIAINYRAYIAELDNMALNLGYAFQKQGEFSENDENRFTAGLKKNFKLSEQVDLSVIAEYANMLDSGGSVNHRHTWLNFGGRLNYDKAFLSSVITEKRSNDSDHNTNYYNIAVGYEIFDDVEASIGYRAEDAKGDRTNSVMFMLGYQFDICSCIMD